ncbi:MAG: hypothetical protein Q8O43_00945 [Dehalococcoidia bacterium]|nr:hypothetical protein [Dehalococcoidia bacterium]
MPIDSFGQYTILTGHEGKGNCWFCGAGFPDKRSRRFCSNICRSKYQESFYWSWASNAAIRRAKYRL